MAGDSVELSYTGERYIPGYGGAELALEHVHRYAVAAALCSGADVVDVGCGEGYGSALLAGDAASVLGVDIDPEAVGHARAAHAEPGLRFEEADAAALPLGDGAVARAVCFEVLEHVEHPDAVLHELARVLAPDGLAILSTPNVAVATDAHPAENPYHRRAYERDELVAAVEAHFPHVAVLGQAIVVGSAVWRPDADAAAATVPLELSATPVRYFIVVASERAVPELTGSFHADGDGVLVEERVRFWRDGVEATGRAEREASRAQELQEQLREVGRQLVASEARAAAARVEAERCDDLEESLAGLDEALAARTAEVAALRAELDLVYGSRSWRLLRPAREARSRVRGG
jgi:2-polyprenyl-3-methyl-5-hydroxy-6-metoxy-1,4-benzoquinol methylase